MDSDLENQQPKIITSNVTQINLVDLPDLLAIKWEPAHRRFPYVSLLAKGFVPLIPALITAVYIISTAKSVRSLGFLLAGYGFFVALFAGYGFVYAKTYKYIITTSKILIHSGVFWQKTTAVPINRIQHIDLNQGPLERVFGLASCKFYTAGGGTGDPRVKGLLLDEAKRVRQFVLSQLEVTDNDL